jgi:hypothetical protein
LWLPPKIEPYRFLERGIVVNEVIILHGNKPGRILQAVIENKIPVIMSYLSNQRWRVVRAMITSLEDNRFEVKVSPQKKSHSINVQINQSVGISLKYGYGDGYDKFIFGATVTGFKSSSSPGGDTIALAVPEQIELVQRRSYQRVDVPKSLEVKVQLWHRYYMSGEGMASAEVRQNWRGTLVDISAGGVQIAIDAAQISDFKKGQSLGLRFTPMHYETPLMFNAQIRNILPTADGKSICLGLQMVGLEASPEGRLILQRLCSIVEQYYQMNHIAFHTPPAGSR